MRKKHSLNIMSLFLLTLSIASCASTKEEKHFLVNFINLDGSTISSTYYVEGHTIVPPDDIRDYDVPEECHRYFFKGYYDGNEQFKIGTKATKDVTYQATFKIKDKHVFNDVTYTWGIDKAHEDECIGSATCETCNKHVEESAFCSKEIDKVTPCFIAYHYDASFDTIGFVAQRSIECRDVTGEHSFTHMWAKDYIGQSGTYYCDKCGDLNPGSVSKKEGASTVEEVNFAFDTFDVGAKLVSNYGSYTGEEKELVGVVDNQDLANPNELVIDTKSCEKYSTGYAEIQIRLPKIKYSLYKNVSYKMNFDDAYYGVNFKDKVWTEPDTIGAIQGLFIETLLEVSYNSNNDTYNAKLTSGDTSINRELPLEENIVNGDENLTISLNSMFFRTAKIYGLSLESK